MGVKYFSLKLFGLLICTSSTLIASEHLSVTDSIFSARIERDEWGVPHIYGKRDADVSFGLAYAHAQDDYETMKDVVYMLFEDSLHPYMEEMLQ